MGDLQSVKQKVKTGEDQHEDVRIEQQSDADTSTAVDAAKENETVFDFEKISHAIYNFAEKKKAEDKMVDYVIFANKTFTQAGDNTIRIPLYNEIQKKQLEALKPELTGYIKSETGIKDFEIEGEVMQNQEKGNMLYTDTDKLNYLVKKYPDIEKLKQKLGLETDM